MRRRAGVVGVVLLSGGAWAAGCTSSSSPGAPGTDGGLTYDGNLPDFDANLPDGAPFTYDAGSHDATVTDSALPTEDSAVPSTDAPAAIDSGSDSGVDAGVDAGTDAGAGAVAVISGLALGTTRQSHSSTLLANGHVLICGGYYGPTASSTTCDDFNPTTNTISAGPSMQYGRESHTATLLPSGKVLFAGGTGVSDAGVFNELKNAEIYDPAGPSFVAVANAPVVARGGAAAVLLTAGASAGQVAILGGEGDGTLDSGTPNDFALDSVEVFNPGSDPTQGTFTLLTSRMSVRRAGPTAASLPEGGLLAAGGFNGPGGGPYTYFATAETLDPALTAFTATASTMSAQREDPLSVVLPDGRIFIFDGYGATGYAATGDVYDPATRTFTATAMLSQTRTYAAIALLHSGRVMIAGGYGSGGTYGDVLVYDPVSNAFLTTTGTLDPPRAIATATTLNDGRVIIAGGQTSAGMTTTAVDIFTE